MQLCLDVYGICKVFPIYERYSLANQLERVVVSIPSNIAEGSSRHTDIDFAHFLEISLGSAFEVETQLQIAFSLGYINEQKYQEIQDLLVSVQKGLNKFINTLRIPKNEG